MVTISLTDFSSSEGVMSLDISLVKHQSVRQQLCESHIYLKRGMARTESYQYLRCIELIIPFVFRKKE